MYTCIGYLERGMAPLKWNHESKEIPEQFIQVLRPSNCYGSSPKCILQHQVPAYYPGNQLTHCCIRIGISTTCNRYHTGKLGIAQTCKGTAKSGNGKRDSNCRTGMSTGCCSRSYENACTNNGSNA